MEIPDWFSRLVEKSGLTAQRAREALDKEIRTIQAQRKRFPWEPKSFSYGRYCKILHSDAEKAGSFIGRDPQTIRTPQEAADRMIEVANHVNPRGAQELTVRVTSSELSVVMAGIAGACSLLDHLGEQGIIDIDALPPGS